MSDNTPAVSAVEYVIADYDGKPVNVGTRVRYHDFDANHPEFPAARAKYEGVVLEITEFDGDVDDDTGRSIVIPPDVVVRHDDGEIASYTTSEWTFKLVGRTPSDENPEQVPMGGKVEELTVIA